MDSTDHMVVPIGLTNERTNVTGGIRYNSETKIFEGYDGVAWGSLSSVMDVDKDTYISDKPLYFENEKYLNLSICKNIFGKILFNYQTYAFKKLEKSLNLNEIEIELFNYNNTLCDLSNSEHILHLKIHCNNSKCTDSSEESPIENDSNSSL